MRIMNTLKKSMDWNKGQVTMYLSGILCFSFGAKFFIDAHLGVDPLDVLIIGLSQHLHLTIGLASGLVAIGFLAVWSAWNRRYPPLMPFVTTFLVGNLIDLWILLRLDSYTTPVLRPVPMLVAGLMMAAYGSSLIIMSGIGIRIMDLVAITMIQKWGWTFFAAKMFLEIFLFGSGWLMGGPVGFATIAFILLVGPFIQPYMWANARFLRLPNHGLKEKRA